MSNLLFRRLAEDIREARVDDVPGVRLYDFLSSSGEWTLSREQSNGALVLWEPESYMMYDVVNWQILDERHRTLPRGTFAQQVTRGMIVARAMTDGAYIALRRLHKTGQLGCSAACLQRSEWHCSYFVQAGRHYEPQYVALRDYLAQEEGLHPLAAAFVALYFTKPLTGVR